MLGWLFKPKEYVASICKHTTKRFCKVRVGEQEFFANLEKNPEYCGECLAKMAIICYNCQGIIMPQDLITLYGIDPPPANAILHEGSPVGCIHCAEMGFADAVGQWVPPGKVVIRPFEELVSIR